MIVAGIYVPAAVAAELSLALRGVPLSDEARTVRDEFDTALQAVERAARAEGSREGSRASNDEFSADTLNPVIGTERAGAGEVAQRLNCSRENVTKRFRLGSLRGVQDSSGRWWMAIEDFQSLPDRRTRENA